MKITTALMILGLSSLGVWSASTADASTVFLLNTTADAGLINGTTYGTVSLDQISGTQVNVGVALASGVSFLNTGGDKNPTHTPFVFNLKTAAGTNEVVSIIGPTSCGTGPTTPCFSPSTALTSPATPFGDFTNGISLNLGNGSGTANPTSLNFSVSNAAGILIADFIQNIVSTNPTVLGWYFAADLSFKGNTGSVAAALRGPGSAPPGEVPLPGALSLLVGGLGGMAWLSRRQKRKGVTTV